MYLPTASLLFNSLASGVRLNVFRLLVKQGPEGMVAGEIGAALEVPPANLSFHLKALTQTQLITVTQEGRFQRYRANIPLMLDLVAYLTEECCSGHPEQCGVGKDQISQLGSVPNLGSDPNNPISRPDSN
jgi:DNA-binding transcriptional ArsR family regulator